MNKQSRLNKIEEKLNIKPRPDTVTVHDLTDNQLASIIRGKPTEAKTITDDELTAIIRGHSG